MRKNEEDAHRDQTNDRKTQYHSISGGALSNHKKVNVATMCSAACFRDLLGLAY